MSPLTITSLLFSFALLGHIHQSKELGEGAAASGESKYRYCSGRQQGRSGQQESCWLSGVFIGTHNNLCESASDMFLTHLHAFFRRRRHMQTTTAYSSWRRLQRPPWTWTRSSWLSVRSHLSYWLSSSLEQNTAIWYQFQLPQNKRSTRCHTQSLKYCRWFNSVQI